MFATCNSCSRDFYSTCGKLEETRVAKSYESEYEHNFIVKLDIAADKRLFYIILTTLHVTENVNVTSCKNSRTSSFLIRRILGAS